MTCGYICPQCEGKGFMDSGEACDYCNPATKNVHEEVKTEEELNDGTEAKT